MKLLGENYEEIILKKWEYEENNEKKRTPHHKIIKEKECKITMTNYVKKKIVFARKNIIFKNEI